MRKVLLGAAAASAVIAVPALAGSDRNEFEARLDARQEVPRNDSPGEGEAEFRISRTGRSIAYEIEAEDLTGRVQAAHIHSGRPGQAGPVIINICSRPCSLPRRGRLTARRFKRAPGVRSFRVAVARLRAGRTYVNLHTARHPAGEIRGQIRRDRSGRG